MSFVGHVALVGRERLDAAAVEDLPLDRSRARALHARRRRAGRAAPRAAPGSSAGRRRRRSATPRPSRASARRRAGCPRPRRGSAREARRRDPCRRAGARSARPSRAADSGSSSTVVALSLPPAQIGRRSSSSGRAMQTSRIGASRLQSATCSTRSRKVGSAQCRSSKTQTTRRRLLEQLAERPGDLVRGRSCVRLAEQRGDRRGRPRV